jgi:hypothetical protein
MFLMVKSPFSYGFPMVFYHPKQVPDHKKTPFFRRQLGASSASQGGRECVLAD